MSILGIQIVTSRFPLKTAINENNDNCEKYDPVSPLRDNCSIDVIISTDWSMY